MGGSRHKTSWLLAGALVVFGLWLPAGATQSGTSKHKKKKEEAPAPYVPSPLQPLTLDQMPAVAPTVTYQGGLLAIVAPNCTLSDVLRAVHKQTGANVDVPANATERVAVHLGPGPAPDVLASLLNGSHFNYIVLGSAADRNQVSQVILTAKTGGVGGAPAAVANNMPQQGAYPPGAYPGGQPPQMQAQETPDNSDGDNVDTSGGDAVEDASADQNDQQDQGQENAANPGVPGQVKTPEQLLQELQQQQQQQQLLLQQQQQQQTSGQPQSIYPTPSGVPVPQRPGPPQH